MKNRGRKRRKKRIRINYLRFSISIIVFLAIIILLFTGVRSLLGRNEKKTVNKTEEINDVKEEENQSLTQSQKLNDFEKVSSLIKESHPYFDQNIISKQVDWDGISETYKQKVLKTANDSEFIDLLSEYVNQLNDEDTHILNNEFYNYLNEKYQEENKTPWLKVLNSDKSKKTYKLLSSDIIDNLLEENADTMTGSNLKLEKPVNGNLAYIKIKSFKDKYKEGDGKIIRDFLNEIKDYNYLVIDISGIKEGENSYWIDNLVSPITNHHLQLFGRLAKKDDSFSEFLDYSYKNKNEYMVYGDEYPINELPVELNSPDYIRDSFKSYLRFEINVSPKDPVDLSAGIYLIQDKDVYGAADTFSQFCRATGFANVLGKTTKGHGMTGEIDPILYSLPNSGLILRMPAVMGLDYSGASTTSSGTNPDIELTKDIIDIQEIVNFVH
ncbi:MAG: S41 family peptidase [Tissierellia bacterium]|nr:S41 family peptidase [Tissierellia bacterium]